MSTKTSLSKEGLAGQALVRPYQERDRRAIRKICSDAALEKSDSRFHEDRQLAPMFYVDYYLQCEPESCFVAEAGGRVVGYIVATKNTRAFNRIFRKRFRRRIVAHVVCKLLTLRYRRKATYQALWWSLVGRLRKREKLDIPLDEYPAHSHMNLVPEFRGCGLSNRLSDALRRHLLENGIGSMHAILIERVGDDSLLRRFSGRRNYQLLGTCRHRLLEKMTGEEWQMKLIVRTLKREP
jgi:hypothetical protein